MDRLYGPGAALRPTVDKMVTPWAGIEASWTLTPGTKRLQCSEDGEEGVPGQLYLSPAPGEQFDLTVQLADQLLNFVSATIYVEVEHESVTTPPGVLIQLNGIQYSYTDRYTCIYYFGQVAFLTSIMVGCWVGSANGLLGICRLTIVSSLCKSCLQLNTSQKMCIALL